MKKSIYVAALGAAALTNYASSAPLVGCDFSDAATFNEPGGAYDIVNVDDIDPGDAVTVSATWGFANGGQLLGRDNNAQLGMPDDQVAKLDGDIAAVLGVAGDPLPTAPEAYFDVTIPEGTTVNLTSVTFNWRQATGGDAGRALAFGTDIDGLLAFKAVGVGRNTGYVAETVDLSAAQYQGLTGTTVRFSWFAGEGGGSGDIDIDTIIVNGDIAAPADDDMDGLADTWEDQYFGNNDGNPTPAELLIARGTQAQDPALGANWDNDADDLDNLGEQGAGTNPSLADTDGDLLNDGPEVHATDNGGTPTGYAATDPLDQDSDDDTLDDLEEVSGSVNTGYSNEPTDPNEADSDLDTLADGDEINSFGTDPNEDDTDGDGFTDDLELTPPYAAAGFDPIDDNGGDNPDNDGLTNSEELIEGTNVLLADTDGDGLNDGPEVNATDNSGTPSGFTATDPLYPDSDDDFINGIGDFANDLEEIDNATDPNDPADFPRVAWLQVDFSNTASAVPSAVHELLYQPYFASRGILASDDPVYGVDRTDVPYAATYPGGSATVLVSVSYPDITDPPAEAGTMIVINRAGNMGTYEGTKGELVQDWIGVDTRSGPTLKTFRLTLGDLPAGDYLLRSYHHDQENQAARFTVTVTDSDSAAEELPAVIRQTTQLSGNNPATPGAGNGPEVLSSTLEQVIRSNGTDPVVVDFTVIGNDPGDPVPDDIFAINGFELTATVDADGDDIADAVEIALFGAITVTDGSGDQDQDGVSDLTEILQNTDPKDADTDGDGLVDGLENDTGFIGLASVDIMSFSAVSDPTDPMISMDWTPAVESDIYGSLDLAGFPILIAEGVTPPVTDLVLPDDFDGAPAGFFMVDPPAPGYGTSPFIADSDGDTVSDGDEVNTYGSDPNSVETDGDGFTDGHEVLAGSSPADPASVPDQDGDGYANSTETNAGTDPEDDTDFPQADSATEFWVDFNSAGTVADPLNPADPTTPTYSQRGYQSYHAQQETSTTFVPADYAAFGTTVTLTPAFPGYETINAVQQSYDRGNGNAATWDGDQRDMMRDWIGIDTRAGGGAYDGTTGTPTPLELTLAGLPAGDYDWTSFHHDVENMWSDFRVEVSVDGGTTYGAPTDLTMTDGQGGGTPASPQTYDGPVNPGSLLPEDLPSTFTTSFTADGANSVVFRFTTLSTTEVHKAFFAMNAFKLVQTATP